MVGILIDQRALLHRLVNRRDILKALAPDYDHVDLSAFFDNPKNIMLGDERGAAIFAHRDADPGVFEGHYLFPHITRLARGKATVLLCRDFLRTMFTVHAAKAIWGYTPIENAAARALSRSLGFAPRGTSLLPSGRPCVVYVLERDTWAKSSGESSAA